MNIHDSAFRLRKIASDILDAAEGMSEYEGEIVHVDVIRVMALVTEAVLKALAMNNPGAGIREYREAYDVVLDVLCVKMERV